MCVWAGLVVTFGLLKLCYTMLRDKLQQCLVKPCIVNVAFIKRKCINSTPDMATCVMRRAHHRLQVDLGASMQPCLCRSAPSYMDSKLEAPTKDLMELIFSDIMFQQAMQVHKRCHSAMSTSVLIYPA